MINIKIPTITINDTIDKLLEVFSVFPNKDQEISLDFSQCSFITAQAIAVLAGLKLLFNYQNKKLLIIRESISDIRVEKIIKKSGLWKFFFGGRRSPKGDTLPIYKQDKWYDKTMQKDIIKYIDSEIMNRPAMPAMSDLLARDIRRSFFEIFGNVSHHSESEIGGIVCGQVYPDKNLLQVVFYDSGIGIAKKVRNKIKELPKDSGAISWALQVGTSTSASEEQSRGLGLYLLTDFIKVNKGEFFIYANHGLVSETNGKRLVKELDYELQGTLIDLRIKITKIKYQYKYENL